MILVAGGTGHLGRVLVSRLTAKGCSVRVLTRYPERASEMRGVELVQGDVFDRSSIASAMTGVTQVVSAITGFGPGGKGPRDVDQRGNLTLIRAAEQVGVRRFVLVSMRGARADHPMQLLRAKHAAEAALRSSALSWTIVRPTIFMELWVEIIGRALIESGTAIVFGSGENAVNFVSVRDVAEVIEVALAGDLAMQAVDVGGPENVSLNDVVRALAVSAGRRPKARHVPVPVLNLARLALLPVRPDISGLVHAGISMTWPEMAFDDDDLRARFPQLRPRRLSEVAEALVQGQPAATRRGSLHKDSAKQ